MKKKIIIFIFFYATVIFGNSQSCYSVQLLSSYTPFHKNTFPKNATIMHIGKTYTVRHGCYEHYKDAKQDLRQLKDNYPRAMITSTYKWRFQKQEPKKVKPVVVENSSNTTFLNTSLNETSIQQSGPKCYSVQLQSGLTKLSRINFPSGTHIIHNTHFYKARYGCYKGINEVKNILYKMRETYPRSIIVFVPEEEFKHKVILPEITKKRIIEKETLFKKSKPSFLVLQEPQPLHKETTRTKCQGKYKDDIVSCRGRCAKTHQTDRWKKIDLDAAKQYVASNFNDKSYLQPLQASDVLIQNPQKNQLNIVDDGSFRYYMTATLDIKRGQTDNNGTTYEQQSLTLSPGLQYLYNFSPSWYFYTDDRLIFSMNKSGTDLKFDVKDMYVSSKNLFDNRANFLLGRKYLKDRRGWYYKTALDTIGISNKDDLLLYEFYLGTRLNKNTMAYDPNAIQTNLKGVKFFFGHLSYEYRKDNTIEAFYIYEDNKNALKKLGWTGFRLQGSLPQQNLNNLLYWIDVASMSGKYQNNSAIGLGYDFGALYYMNEKDIGLGASLAYGSGGSKRYMQPSFTNNRSNYLSKDVSYRYYGEFLQPELSNMWISTINLVHHFNGDQNTTAIVALHNYTQDKAIKSQYNATNKTVLPNGKSTQIGNEIDLILHYDLFTNSYWRFSFGYFMGGSAFNNKTTKKDGFNAQLYYKYVW